MKNSFLLLATLFFTTIGSAVGQDVSFNVDKETDFLKFKTYRWAPSRESATVDEKMDQQIKETVDSEFAKKGLTKTDVDPADLYIGYQAGVGTEKQFASCNARWACFSGLYASGCFSLGASFMRRAETMMLDKGELLLHMYDQRNHEIVWCGVASRTVDPKAQPEKQQKNLQKSVAKLLKHYPPRKH